MIPIRLTAADAKRLGLVADEAPAKPQKEWGSTGQAENVQRWSKRRACILGKSYPATEAPVHLWQALDAFTWLARCGKQKSRDGWVPDGRGGEPACKWCFKKGEG